MSTRGDLAGKNSSGWSGVEFDLARGLDEEARRQYGGAASAGSWLEGAVNLADVIKKAAGHHDDW